jgi:acyl-CoA synthetase
VNTIAAVAARNAAHDPDGVAFFEAASGRTLTWHQYDTRSDEVAATLAAAYEPGTRIALHLPDGADIHVAMLACEKAGVVGVGIGSRAGSREVDHLVARSGARAVLTELPSQSSSAPGNNRALSPKDLWFLNSTSGTTGLPKIVMHDQARWFAFHEFAQRVAHFDATDVFASALPTPFGFGLWTAHFTPAITGAPCVVFERFAPELALAAIERYRVTILAAVSTQFVMMLNAPELADHDVSSLRILFTGGEMVPYEQARAFEEHTGASVLQFYGSNETGALSCTTPADPPEQRLRTAGRVIPEMNVRLLDIQEDGRGIPAAKGPALCLGYWDDPTANAELYTSDGWMRMGDLATIDAEGYLTVVGRTSDIIIRGGKNISAVEVEREVGTHPAVALCAAVPVPDETFGERVGVFVELRPGTTLALNELTRHLETRGTGKELWPERLTIVDELPRASGGKIAKGELRDRFGTGQ